MAETTTRADRTELTRRVERAEKLLQKGKAAEALEEYLLVLRDDPEDDTVRALSADLCLSQNRGRDAVRLLGELFERQVNAGDATRASLTYKKLARHGSPTWDQKVRFGQLLEGSNKKLAVGTYESALSDLAKLEDKKDALLVLGRIVALEPTQANFLRVAELSSELGESKASAEAFKRVAQSTTESGGDPAQWYERAYQEDSSDRGNCSGLWEKSIRAGTDWRGDFYSGAAGKCGEDFARTARYLCRGFAGGGTVCGRGAAGVAAI